MLKYNNLECAWECSECGAIYSGKELARVFDYNTNDAEEQRELAKQGKFIHCHCMDCGALWEEIK